MTKASRVQIVGKDDEIRLIVGSPSRSVSETISPEQAEDLARALFEAAQLLRFRRRLGANG